MTADSLRRLLLPCVTCHERKRQTASPARTLTHSAGRGDTESLTKAFRRLASPRHGDQ